MTDQEHADSITPLSDLLREVRAGKGTPDEYPESVGPYKILGILGEGGMGTVYLAERSKPVRQRVALKVVKLGMDTKQTLARFETERETLALLDHPSVAKVLDAGSDEQGRPYFAMEHVPGIPITEYCDTHRLTNEDRLRLFIDICSAVQHAHQKGIIHRDIKPSNVLVAVHGDKLLPKVIDFGVAKATQGRLTEVTLFTEQGQLIGTPGYMSPEQAEMNALDIDTRTDVYALGILLYELLVGARPFDDVTLRKAGYAEMQRIIREVSPPKPSTKLTSMGDMSTSVARKRNTEVGRLRRLLRGDLDWVIMKCLEKDRTRRYDTANALAMDVQRHLDSEPVLAGPPSITYRFRKFAVRNSGFVLSAIIVVAALSGGLTLATLGMLEANSQRLVAEKRQSEAEQARKDAIEKTELAEDRLSVIEQFVHVLSRSGAGDWTPTSGVVSDRWKAIVIHHSATKRGSIKKFELAQRGMGFDEIGYHFVIASDPSSPDGLVAPTIRWHKQKHGAHCKTPDNYFNDHGVGICLIGDFTSKPPSEGQLSALQGLVLWLINTADISPNQIYTHRAALSAGFGTVAVNKSNYDELRDNIRKERELLLEMIALLESTAEELEEQNGRDAQVQAITMRQKITQHKAEADMLEEKLLQLAKSKNKMKGGRTQCPGLSFPIDEFQNSINSKLQESQD